MRTIPVFLLLAAGFMAACGDRGESAPAERSETTTPATNVPAIPGNLEGRTYVADQLTVDSSQRPAVSGTRIEVSFFDDSVGIRAGCNTMGGRYRVDAGRLIVEELTSTAKGCEPALLEQDALLQELMTASPQLTISDSTRELTISTERLALTGVDHD